jgi:hypothetical protein
MKRRFWFVLLLLSLGIATAQNPQTSLDRHEDHIQQPPFLVNSGYTNGVAPGYRPTAGSGLTLNIGSGTAFCLGTLQTYAAGTLSMTNTATNYVYLDPASNCAPASSTSVFSSTVIPIAKVVTSGGAITAITDDRTLFVNPPSAAGFTATYTNDTTTGTVVNQPAEMNSLTGNKVIKITGSGDYKNAPYVGIVTGGAGTSGSATVQYGGTAPCVFVNAVTANDYVSIDKSSGQCKSQGSSPIDSESNSRMLLIGMAAASGSAGATVNVNLGTPGPKRYSSNGWSSFLIAPYGSMVPQFSPQLFLMNGTAGADAATVPIAVGQSSCLTFINSSNTAQYGELTQGAGGV